MCTACRAQRWHSRCYSFARAAVARGHVLRVPPFAEERVPPLRRRAEVWPTAFSAAVLLRRRYGIALEATLSFAEQGDSFMA